MSLAGAWKQLCRSSDCDRSGRLTVPGGQTSSCKNPGRPYTCWVGDVARAVDFAQRNRDVSGCTVERSEQRGTEMSGHSGIDGPWPPCLKFKRYSISDVKPVELLVEADWIVDRIFACVAGDARGSIEYTRCSWSARAFGALARTELQHSRFWRWRSRERVSLLIRRLATVVSAEVDEVGRSSVPRLSRLRLDSMSTPSGRTE